MTIRWDKICDKCSCWRFSNPNNKCTTCGTQLRSLDDPPLKVDIPKQVRPFSLHFNGKSYANFSS